LAQSPNECQTRTFSGSHPSQKLKGAKEVIEVAEVAKEAEDRASRIGGVNRL
jgi:hypothetical protein